MRRAVHEHLRAHPYRLLVTTLVILLASGILAGGVTVYTLSDTRSTSEAACRSVNELRRTLFVAAADLGWPDYIRERFRPTEKCEGTP